MVEPPNERMRLMAKKIRAGLARKGWTQGQLEQEAGFAHGALSRILAGRQQRVLPKTVHRIARALNLSPEELAEGLTLPVDEPARRNGIGPTLSELPGYANAELQVARLEPWVPVEVFEAARGTRLPLLPPEVTVEFLRSHVVFLAEHVFRIGKTSGTRAREDGARARAAAPKRRG